MTAGTELRHRPPDHGTPPTRPHRGLRPPPHPPARLNHPRPHPRASPPTPSPTSSAPASTRKPPPDDHTPRPPPPAAPAPAPDNGDGDGDGTVYQRKDSRWEAAGYVLAPDNTRKRVHVYGTTRKEALAKLTEKIANSNRGVPVPSAQGSLGAYLTYWLETVAVHQLRENTHTRYTACINRYLAPAWARRSSQNSLPRTSAPGSTSSAPPASAARAASIRAAVSPVAAPPDRAAPSGSPR